MELKLFGLSLFEYSKDKASKYIELASNQVKESKFLPDFHGMVSGGTDFANSIISFQSWSTNETGSSATLAVPEPATIESDKKIAPKAEAAKEETPPPPSPKEIFHLRTLNDEGYKIKTDDAYVDSQIQSFEDKLRLVSSEEYDMRRGVQEIGSILTRLKNRKLYAEHRGFFEQYAYTTTSKINEVLNTQSHLKLGQVAQFLADMPRDAVDAMKKYNQHTDEICGKQAVFYIIANKKDFQKSDQRRDPILLAQSPFAHVWQILGAWDEEMEFLEQL